MGFRSQSLLLPLLWIPFSSAQTNRPPSVVSPEIGADHKVTFRLYAPKAAEVLVTGDWMARADQIVHLAKGGDGVWVGTTEPLEPNAYFYTFAVDGVRAPDPRNPRSVMSGERTPESYFEIRGGSARPWQLQPVPKGTLHIEYFQSARQGREFSYYVYSPPGFRSQQKTRLPLLVLLPGTSGAEGDWITVGLANRVVDNLLAQRKLKPLLVLMPRADVLIQGGSRAENLQEFERLLLDEILPHFEVKYRPHAKPEQHAIAGYSLGGELALTIGLRHPERFRTVGSFAGSLFENELKGRFAKVWANPKLTASQYRLIWIGCGADDRLLPGSRKLSEDLTASNIPNVLREIPGHHATPTFRTLLIEFAEHLFKGN